MQTLADLLQPYFASRVQGKEAVRVARDSLNRENFARQVEAIREKQAQDRKLKEQSFQAALGLLGNYTPQDIQGAVESGLKRGVPLDISALPKIDLKTLNEQAKRAAELEQLKMKLDSAAKIAQQRAAQTSASNNLKKFELDTATKAYTSLFPPTAQLGQQLAQDRAAKANIEATLKADNPTMVTPGGVLDYNSLKAMQDSTQERNPLLDSLFNINAAMNQKLADSTNWANVARMQLMNSGGQFETPPLDEEHQNLYEYWNELLFPDSLGNK